MYVCQNMALGTRTNLQLEILNINLIADIVYLFCRARETLVKQPPDQLNRRQ